MKLLSFNNKIKVHLGNNPFSEKKINLTNKHLLEMLERDLMVLFRSSLDDVATRLDRTYFELKSFLRTMLIHRGDIEKKDLLVEFQKEYGNRIIFPKKFERILNKNIKSEDYEDVLNFCNSCLEYLSDRLERK